MRRGALRLRGAGFVLVVVRLLGAVVQHQRLGLVGDGDGAGALRPRLAVHLHGHRGALQNQLQRRGGGGPPNVRTGGILTVFISEYCLNVFSQQLLKMKDLLDEESAA